MKRFVSVGECMIEMAGGENGNYQQGFAGDTLNTAWYAHAALGDDWSVDYFTAVGDDLYSQRMIDFLAGNGIGTSLIRRIPHKRPGLYMIHQQDGDRHFTYWRDSSAAKLLADDETTLSAALMEANVVYFSGITLAILTREARMRLLAAIGNARAAGVRTAFDPNIRPILWSGKAEIEEAIVAAAKVSSFVLPTHTDEVPYFGDISALATAERYLRFGVDEVVVKNGADNALIASGAETVVVPANKVDDVVDATGAGDSFNGAYLAARLSGESMSAAGEIAHKTAGKVIRYRGALIDPKLLV